MLSNESFRRTKRCGHYKKLLEEKDASIPLFPVEKVEGGSLNTALLNKHGLDQPLLVEEDGSAGLGLQLPKVTKLTEVSKQIGVHTPVKFIEVGTQTQVEGYNIGQFSE